MAFAVETPVYEGPLDLLLQLILKEQVDLYEVDLATIVDAYLAEVERLQALDLEVATEFLLIAATLVELKTAGCFPGTMMVTLMKSLRCGQSVISCLPDCSNAKHLKMSPGCSIAFEQADLCFPRRTGADERFAGLMPDLLEGTSIRRFQSAAIRALTPKPEPIVDLFHVLDTNHVAEAVDELLAELPIVGRINFKRLTGDLVERVEVIVRFLAVLELFKQGIVDIEQFINLARSTSSRGDADTDLSVLAIDDYEG